MERDAEDEDIRIVRQMKNSRAPKGKDLRFKIRSDTGFQWLVGTKSVDTPKVMMEPTGSYIPKGKHELVAMLIKKMLADVGRYILGLSHLTISKADAYAADMLETFL